MWMGLNVKNVLAVDPTRWHKSILFYEDRTVVRENPDFTLHNYKLPNLILPPANEDAGKVMFSQASVILFTRRGGGGGGLCRGILSWKPPPRTVTSGRYASYWNAFLFFCVAASNTDDKHQRKLFGHGSMPTVRIAAVHTREHGGSSGQHTVGVQVLPDVHVALHDRVVARLVDSSRFHTCRQKAMNSLKIFGIFVGRGV